MVIATCFFLVLPLLWIGRLQWVEAEGRALAAMESMESAQRLEVLLRLAPALSAERTSATVSGSDELIAGLSPGALEQLGFDFAGSVVEDRVRVDALLEAGDYQELRAEIEAARAVVDSADSSVFETADRYEKVTDRVREALEDELDRLAAAATSAGDDEVANAARVAQTAAHLQSIASGQSIPWVQLEASAFISPSVAEVQAFSESVALYRHELREFEQIVPERGPVALEWQEFQGIEETTFLYDLHAETLTRLAVAGVPEASEDPIEIDLSTTDLDELAGVASKIIGGIEAADAVSAGLGDLVDTSLQEFRAAAETSVASASAERNQTGAWVVGSLVLFSVAAAVLVVLIARPLRRMGEVAQSITVGELGVRMDERGPKEIRVGALAMNQALAVLRRAQAQADALAEERLSDPVLADPTPGKLGHSLQAAVGRLASTMIEREEFQRRLAHEASHDGLTKLANRKAVLKHLGAALARTRRSSVSIALLFLDVDDFKTINDVHGHQVGDHVLRTIAQRLVVATRDGDHVGRLGGDEFVVIAEPVLDIDEALSLSHRVLDEVAKPITVDGLTITPSISIGVGIDGGNLTPDELLIDADLAVYRAKSLGKGRVDVCDEKLRGEMQARTTLEGAIRSAIEDNELVLFYQPTIDSKTGRITSLEALIRWDRPGTGLVGPDQFIPTAERSDLIIDIDRWVLATASRQLKDWAGHELLGSIPVSVNISGRHLGHGTLHRDVVDALRVHGVKPERLVLEVTETALLEDVAAAAHELSQLRRVGVRVALDDFGTGYMSLAHLRGLPVDVLKIDRSFVAALETKADHSLVQLIVDTGHLLGVAVTAEGVETQTQAETLTHMGSDYLQGYLYSRPIDAESTEQLVNRSLGLAASTSGQTE